MKIGFIGAVEFFQRALERLIGLRADVIGVCTLKEPSANVDHRNLSPVAQTNRIPWRYAPDINSAEIIQRLLRGRLSLGVVGFHPAALPVNRTSKRV